MKRFNLLCIWLFLLTLILSACGSTPAVSSTPTAVPNTPTVSNTPAGPQPTQQFVITENDNGKTFTYTVTSRFTVELDQNRYPKENLSCEPAGIIGSISNIPAVEPPLFAARFEAVKPGTCTLRDDGFEVSIRVVE